MKSHANSRTGQYRKMALALSLVLGVSPLQANTAIEPAKDSPVAALLRRAVETNLEQLPADLVKFKASPGADEMHGSNAHSKATHLVTNCNNDGPGSLRAAVAAAASGDTVDLSGLSCTTITLTRSIVTDVDSLTLKDSGGVREISGGNRIRPIMHNGTGALTLDGVSVIKGAFHHFPAHGGCIYSKGNVVVGRFLGRGAQVRDCEVTGNAGVGAKGGGIYAKGTVTLVNGAVKRNRAISMEATALGGGIYAGSGIAMLGGVIEGNEVRGARGVSGGGAFTRGGIHAKYSTVWDNKAIARDELYDFGGAPATGGGLDVGSFSSESLIKGVTISGNSVKADGNDSLAEGAGIHIRGNLTISSSTIADNLGEGGRRVLGALVVGGSEVTINASTISGNKVRSLSQSNERGWGAGISMQNHLNLTLQSSIVAGNNIASISGQSLASDIGVLWPDENISVEIIGERNFINFHHSGISWASTNNDIFPTIAANLEPLRDNGGLTLTMMPRADSPVINRGLDLGLDYDQRGSGYARVYGPRADIGAVERGSIYMGIFHDHFE